MVAAMQATTKYLRTADVAARLGLSKRTVHRRALTGEIPNVGKTYEPNGPFLFDPAVIDVLARNAQRAAS